MGLVGGTQNGLSLERAFMGFRMFEGETFNIDAELGRRSLSYTFDSRIQFSSFMDGILMKYNQTSERFGDLYLYGGPFVVNETKDHFAFVIELGILNLYNTGLYAKYSMIDWNTKHFDDIIRRRRFQFF